MKYHISLESWKTSRLCWDVFSNSDVLALTNHTSPYMSVCVCKWFANTLAFGSEMSSFWRYNVQPQCNEDWSRSWYDFQLNPLMCILDAIMFLCGIHPKWNYDCLNHGLITVTKSRAGLLRLYYKWNCWCQLRHILRQTGQPQAGTG